jgi:predicted O-linked N-acetylglucosamine transferase (SPINDLY family)
MAADQLNSAQVNSALEAGIRYHDAGNLLEAERHYARVLKLDPRHAKATYLLGLLAQQVGKHELAVKILSSAIKLDARQPTFHCVLAESLRVQGNHRDAVASYRQALRLNSEYVDAHNNLGALLQAEGDLLAATQCFRRAIELAPGYAAAHHNLGCVWQQQGKWAPAEECFSAALRIQPDYFDARLALGGVLQAQGKDAAAEAHFAALEQAAPKSSQVACARGVGYHSAGNLDAAIACYCRAIELDPNSANAYYNLGAVLQEANRDLEAIEAYQQATRLNPRLAAAWSNLGNAYLGLVRPDEALDAIRTSLELEPRSHLGLGNLATALQLQGDMDGAIAAFRRAIECNPGDANNHSNLVYTLNFHPGYDSPARFAEHLAWGAQHADALTALAPPHTNERDPERRLRVGYVSAHFREHAVAFFSEPLLAAHGHEQFEIVCYSDVSTPDATTERFRARADLWRGTTRLSHEQLAQQVRDDRIDVLVDLAGHIGGNRLPMFARKPAPVQVTYLGYQNTTGMRAMDYRLTDAHADPPGITDRWYTERLYRLPDSFFCFAPPEPAPPLGELPCSREGTITFASLNHIPKLTEAAVRIWARILARVPASRLVLLAYSPGVLERNVRAVLAEEGVDPARVDVRNKRPRFNYLKMHDEIDIALDTFPFNGHTTVCDALWMGVPSIMLEGDSYASRFGGSTLLGVGLGDLIARSPDEYVDLAVNLATDRERLTELRRTLRERLRQSSLVDAPRFAAQVETAYRDMWRAWCAS